MCGRNGGGAWHGIAGLVFTDKTIVYPLTLYNICGENDIYHPARSRKGLLELWTAMPPGVHYYSLRMA